MGSDQIEPKLKSPHHLGSFLKRTKSSAHWFLYKNFPKFFFAPNFDFDQNYFDELDSHENLITSLPENQSVELACIWVCEVFGPGEISKLYDGLLSLGLDTSSSNPNRSAIAWVKSQRQYGFGGWLNLGWIVRKNVLTLPLSRAGNFPDAFSIVKLDIHQICPSLTCLLVGLVVSDNTSSIYQNALSAKYKTTVEPINDTHALRYIQVEQKKHDAVANAQSSVRELAIGWVIQNFPGYFSTNSKFSHFPTGELNLLHGFTAFELVDPKIQVWQHWLWILNLEPKINYWVRKGAEAVRFTFESRNEKLPNHITVAINWASMPNISLSGDKSKSLTSKATEIHEALDEVFANFASTCFLKEIRRDVTETREKIRDFRKLRNSSYSLLLYIEDFFQRNIGISIIAQELKRFSENKVWTDRMMGDFLARSRMKNHKNRKALSLANWFRLQILNGSETALKETDDSKDYFEQLATVLGTRENVRTQWWVFWMSVFALVISIASLVVAVVALSNKPPA